MPVPMAGERSRELPPDACHIRIRARHRFGDSLPGGLPRIGTRLAGRCPETFSNQEGGRAGHGSDPFLLVCLEAVKQAGDGGMGGGVPLLSWISAQSSRRATAQHAGGASIVVISTYGRRQFKAIPAMAFHGATSR